MVTVTDSLILVRFGRGWGKPRRLLSGNLEAGGIEEGGCRGPVASSNASAVPILHTGKFPRREQISDGYRQFRLLQGSRQVGVWDPKPFPSSLTSASTKKPDGNFHSFPCFLFLDSVLIPRR